MNRFLFRLLLCWTVLCGLTVVVPGGSPVAPQLLAQSAVPDDYESVRDGGGLKLAPITATSPIPPRPNCWWPMPLILMNSAETDKTAKILGTVIGHSQSRFSVTIPIGSGRTIRDQLWIRMPDVPAGTPVHLTATLFEMKDGQAIRLNNDGETALQDLRVLLSPDALGTAIVLDRRPTREMPWEWRVDGRYHSFNLANACRELDQLSRMVVDFAALPNDRRAWDAMDNVFICDASGLNDPHGVALLRQWLVDGGKAWITVDRIPLTALEPLIGDVWQATSLGIVEMNDYDIRSKLRPDMSTRPVRVDEYQPVQVKLLQQEGGEVTHRINQWPAAIRVRLGRGEVWLTTVDASAWYEPNPQDPNVAYTPPYMPNAWAVPIVSLFQQPRRQSPPEFLSPAAAASHVGYPVPSRGAVFGSLGFFLVTSLLLGVWFLRNGHLERMGWCLPVVALLSATPLFAAARSNRDQVTDTLSHAQYVELDPGSGQAVIDQSSILYLSKPREVRFDITDDTLMRPFVDSSTVSPFQWAETPNGLRLEFPNWPTGLQNLTGSITTSINTTPADARFTEQGLEVKLPDGLPGETDTQQRFEKADPVVLMPPSRIQAMQPRRGSSGSFLIEAGVPTSRELRLGSGLLDRQRQSHQQTYRSLQRSRDENLFASESIASGESGRPSLLFWTPPWPTPMDDQIDANLTGEALNRMPLRYLPTPAGTDIRLPAITLPANAIVAGYGDTVTTEIASGEIPTPQQSARTWRIVWRVPEAALPLKLTSATFAATLDAPMRDVTISSVSTAGAGDPRSILIGQFKGLSDSIKLEVDPADLVFDENQGTLVIEFSVSDAWQPESESDNPPPDGGQFPTSGSDEDPTWQVIRPEWTLSGTVGS